MTVAGTELVAEPAAPTVSVYLVDDHDVVREGLEAILRREKDLRIVGSAGTAEEALEEIPRHDPDVVVLDHSLPGMDGLSFCREAAERRMRARVVMLSAFLDERIAERAILSGARACVVKNVEAQGLMLAIRAAARGETFVDQQIVGRFVQWGGRVGNIAQQTFVEEARALRLVAQGRTNREIAALTGRAPATVKACLEEAYAKLGVRSRAEAVAVALRGGML